MTLFKYVKHYLIKFLCIAGSLLILGIPFLALQAYYPHKLHSLATILHDYAMFFMGFRWLLIVVFVAAWVKIIHHYSQKQAWSDEKAAFWIKQRWKLAVWLVLFELLVCENILFSLVKAW